MTRQGGKYLERAAGTKKKVGLAAICYRCSMHLLNERKRHRHYTAMPHLLSFVQWLNDTPISVYLRESDWPFPIIETIHILGLGFSVGTIMWLDLRLLGLAMREAPVTDVIEQLEPWAIGGFAVMFVSGSLLILSEPLKCYNTVAFRIKVVLLILAVLNVLYFHKKVMHDVDQWDRNVPWRAKMVGALSLVLWLGVVIAGRWTAYF